MEELPILRPLLPKAESIAKYIKEADEARWYSNFGILNTRLEKSLADRFRVGKECVVTFSSATSALTISLLAMGLKGKKVAVPSFTFIATIDSIIAAGCEPVLFDIDHDLVLDIERVKGVDAVMIVSPFGKILDIERIRERVSVPIIIDGAAAFDSILAWGDIGDVPIIVSMHATKAFGCGEGGFVLCKDKELIERMRAISNFGIADYTIKSFGFNAKLSEYHAAVGLAQLDEWCWKRNKLLGLSRMYREALKGVNVEIFNDEGYVSQTFNIVLKRPISDLIERARINGIEVRRWWMFQLNDDFNSAYYYHRVLGLPYWIGMDKRDIERVVNFVKDSV